MRYIVMQQRHSTIKAVKIKGDYFTNESDARCRQNEMQALHGATHFFWILMLVV